MILNKTILWFFLLIMAFSSCLDESNFASRELLFTGKIKSGDNGQPLSGVMVALNISGYERFSQLSIDISDSVLTNNSGEYSFKVKYDPSVRWLSRYKIQPILDFHDRCSDVGSNIIPLLPLPIMEVDTVTVNTFDLFICQTGHVKLSARKLEPDKKDTLFHGQILESTSGKIYTSGQQITEQQSDQIFKYFTKTVSKTTFKFRIKKEDGSVIFSEESVSVMPNSVTTLNIAY